MDNEEILEKKKNVYAETRNMASTSASVNEKFESHSREELEWNNPGGAAGLLETQANQGGEKSVRFERKARYLQYSHSMKESRDRVQWRPSTSPRFPWRAVGYEECDVIQSGGQGFPFERMPCTLPRLPRSLYAGCAECEAIQNEGGKNLRLEGETENAQDMQNVRERQTEVERKTSEAKDISLDSEGRPLQGSDGNKKDVQLDMKNYQMNSFTRGATVGAILTLISMVIFLFVLLVLVVFFNLKVDMY